MTRQQSLLLHSPGSAGSETLDHGRTPSEILPTGGEFAQGQANEVVALEPIKAATSTQDTPNVQKATSKTTEQDFFRAISRKRTNASGRQGSYMTEEEIIGADQEQAEIEKLMSRMFGQARQKDSEEEKTRHVGLVFRNLTVKGMGLGAALQGT